VNEELAADAEREPDSPPRAASAGPPPSAAGGDPWSRPADRRPDEVTGASSGAGDAAPGRSAASDHWSAWAPSVSSRPGSPSAGDGDEPRDHADEGAAGKDAAAGALGPLFAWRDAAADHASAVEAGKGSPAAAGKESAAGAGKETAGAGKETAGAGKETADAERQGDVKAEEADEEEEVAPSPWSIPLTLVGDLSDLGEEGDDQPAGPGAADGHETRESPAAGHEPAPERTASNVWTRPSRAGAEEKQAGPPEADRGGPEKPDETDRADAGRGPWLTRPGKGTTADWPDRDPGDAAATRADDKAGALPSRSGRDDPPAYAGRDEAATRAGDGAGADDHAKATPANRDDADDRVGRAGGGADDHTEAARAGRDAADRAAAGRAAWAGRDADVLPTRAGRDEAAVRAGRDGGADDEAKATDAARGDDDAASRTRADTDADAAAGTSAASAGSPPGSDSAPSDAGPRTAAEAKPPAATPAGKATPVGRPSATLFGPAISATRGSTPDPAMGETAGPGPQREAPTAAGGAAGQRAPEAGSGTVAGQTGAAPARDGDKRSATDQSGAERSGPTPPPDSNAVVIVPGIARYHRTGCILIRFLGSDDIQTSTAQEATAKGCAPCRACEPDKPLSSGD
jgi:hypothetical protein